MKVAIVGSRGYADLEQVRTYVRALPEGTWVISGGAVGVDNTATDEADKCGLLVEIFPALWHVNGVYDRGAGFKRNVQMVAEADQVVAFWDGVSKGTAHSIRLAREAGKLAGVYYADGSMEQP